MFFMDKNGLNIKKLSINAINLVCKVDRNSTFFKKHVSISDYMSGGHFLYEVITLLRSHPLFCSIIAIRALF